MGPHRGQAGRAPLLAAQTRVVASRGRMLQTSREQVSALPAVGTRRHSGRCFIGSPSDSPTSSEPPPGSHCEGRSGSAARPGVGAGPRQGTVAASPRPLCRVSSRGGRPCRGIRLTPQPCRSDPDRSPVCPTCGTGSTGRSRPSTASSALRRTRGCADVHRAQIPPGSPILARVFRRQAPRRRTGAASCLQLLHGR